MPETVHHVALYIDPCGQRGPPSRRFWHLWVEIVLTVCQESGDRRKARDIRPERIHAEVRYQDLQWSDAEIAVRAKAPKEPGSWTFREDIRPVQSLHRLDP